MGTLLVGVIVVIALGCAAFKLIRDKRSGKSCCGCSGCSGACSGSCSGSCGGCKECHQ